MVLAVTTSSGLEATLQEESLLTRFLVILYTHHTHTQKHTTSHLEPSVSLRTDYRPSSKYNPHFKNQSFTTLQVRNSSSFLADEGLQKKSIKMNRDGGQQVQKACSDAKAGLRLDTGWRTLPSNHKKEHEFG